EFLNFPRIQFLAPARGGRELNSSLLSLAGHEYCAINCTIRLTFRRDHVGEIIELSCLAQALPPRAWDGIEDELAIPLPHPGRVDRIDLDMIRDADIRLGRLKRAVDHHRKATKNLGVYLHQAASFSSV